MLTKILIVATLAVTLNGCGGETTADTASAAILGLSAPASVSIVAEAPSSTAAVMSSSYSGTAGLSSAYNSSNTDYSTQSVDKWVKTGTGSTLLGEINYFLCVIKLANTADYPNKTYRAQHNAKLCRRPSSSWALYGEGPVNREMLVTTSRSSGKAPYKQTLWFSVPYGDKGKNIDWDVVMDMTITEEPSDLNPLGLFEIHFKSIRAPDIGIDYTGTSDYDGVMKAYREGGKSYLSFIFFNTTLYLTGDLAPWNNDTYQSIIIELDGSGGLSGRAVIDQQKGNKDYDYLIREISKVNFNADYINEQKNSDNEVCSSRDGMLSNVWDYKMFYKDTGKALNMNGGFSVTYDAGAKRGWADNYGLSTDNSGDTPSTVTRKKDSAVFNVIRAGGKLVKKTKGNRALATNEELRYWTSDTEYKVKWDGSAFVSMDTETGYVAALSELNAADDSGNARWPWSNRLNQGVKYTGTRDIVYWAEEEVKPWSSELSGGDLSFTCYQFCPQGEVSQTLADVIEWDKSAVEAVDADAYSTAGKTYTFDSTNMLLKYAGTPVVLDPNLSSAVDSRFFMKLTPPGSSVPSPYWRVNELDVHYQWQSGTQEWNKSINFKNQSTNAWYEFAAPVKFDYTHLTTNDLNDSAAYNNISYYLKYDGGLHGIPSSKDADGNYIREINLKDGDIFDGKAKIGTRELVLKAVGVEKNPLASPGSCDNLPLSGVSLTLPDSSSNTITVSKTWAQQFEVIGVPADYLVIDGVAQ